MSAEPSEQRPSPPTTRPAQTDAGSTDEQVDVTKLSPEEQMALYEKDLKETDWGHQPC